MSVNYGDLFIQQPRFKPSLLSYRYYTMFLQEERLFSKLSKGKWCSYGDMICLLRCLSIDGLSEIIWQHNAFLDDFPNNIKITMVDEAPAFKQVVKCVLDKAIEPQAVGNMRYTDYSNFVAELKNLQIPAMPHISEFIHEIKHIVTHTILNDGDVPFLFGTLMDVLKDVANGFYANLLFRMYMKTIDRVDLLHEYLPAKLYGISATMMTFHDLFNSDLFHSTFSYHEVEYDVVKLIHRLPSLYELKQANIDIRASVYNGRPFASYDSTGVSLTPINCAFLKLIAYLSGFPAPQPHKAYLYQEFRELMVAFYGKLLRDRESYDIAVDIGLIDPSDITFRDLTVFTNRNGEEIFFYFPAIMMATEDICTPYYSHRKALARHIRKLWHDEPLTLYFTIAALVFALAGVIAVFQTAGVIPSLRNGN